MSAKASHQQQRAFSLVELLIVIVTISLLVAIGVVSYSGVQKKAFDSSVTSDLDALAGHLETYRTKDDPVNNPSHQFPTNETTLEVLDIKAAKKAYNASATVNLVYCLQTSGSDAYQAYTLLAASKSGKVFMMTQDGLKTNTLTVTDLTNTICNTLGMSLISNGMSSPNTWKPWVESG